MLELANGAVVYNYLLPNQLSWLVSIAIYPSVLLLALHHARANFGVRRYEAFTAIGLFCTNSFQITLCLLLALHYAISQNRDARTLQHSTLLEGLLLFPQATSALLAHLYFFRRARYLSSSRIASALLGVSFILILVCFGSGLGLGVIIIKWRHTDVASMAELPFASIQIFATCCTDILLTSLLVKFLWKFKNTTTGLTTQEALMKMIQLSIECAGLTAATAMIAAALYEALLKNGNIFIIFWNLLFCLYPLSVFLTMSAQENLRKRLNTIPAIKIQLPSSETKGAIQPEAQMPTDRFFQLKEEPSRRRSLEIEQLAVLSYSGSL